MKYHWYLNAVLLGLCLLAPTKSFGQSTLSCNSDDEKKHYCPADTSGGVRLTNQRSGSPCTEGSTWGYDAQGIWVDRGCRAEFSIGANSGGGQYGDRGYGNRGYGQAQIISCNSDDEKRHYCAADTSGGVRLTNQRSGSPCTEGSTWGYDAQRIWVDKGCRGEFAVGASGGYGDNGRYGNRGYGNRGYGSAQTISCNSDDEKRHYCAADTSGGVRLTNQRSGSPCTEGSTWGYDARGIWVDRGCRGEFAVGGGNYGNRRGRGRGRDNDGDNDNDNDGDQNDGYGNNGRYGSGGYGQAQIITCNSDDEKRHYCAADTRGGVRIQNQRSGSPCIEGSTWGYDDQGVWVDRGCRAEFAVGAGRGRGRGRMQRRQRDDNNER